MKPPPPGSWPSTGIGGNIKKDFLFSQTISSRIERIEVINKGGPDVWSHRETGKRKQTPEQELDLNKASEGGIDTIAAIKIVKGIGKLFSCKCRQFSEGKYESLSGYF